MPKVVDKEEKAKVISDAALKVFRERGYHKTRMVDIAQASGIGKGTLYEYFTDKAAILRFAFDQYFGIFIGGVLKAMENKKRPSEKILALIDFALQHVAQWEDHCAIYVDYFGAARTDERDRFSLERIYEEMKVILKELIEQAQTAGEIDNDYNSAAVADLLLAIYDGIILHNIFGGQMSAMDMIRNTTTRLITGGLVKNSFESLIPKTPTAKQT